MNTLHGCGTNKAGSPGKAVMLLSHTTALLRSPCCTVVLRQGARQATNTLAEERYNRIIAHRPSTKVEHFISAFNNSMRGWRPCRHNVGHFAVLFNQFDARMACMPVGAQAVISYRKDWWTGYIMHDAVQHLETRREGKLLPGRPLSCLNLKARLTTKPLTSL